MRILIVEDDPLLNRSLAATLRDEHYAVDTAMDGEEGLIKAREDIYDAIVLDVMMPILDGWQVLEQLRPEIKTPILMLTARDTIPDRIRGLNKGADDYLIKPFDSDELVARLNALIRRSSGLSHSEIQIEYLLLDTSLRRVKLNGELIPGMLLNRFKSGELELPETLLSTFGGTEPGHHFFRIFEDDLSLIVQSENAPASAIPPSMGGGSVKVSFQTHGDFRQIYLSEISGFRMILGQELSPVRSEMHSLTMWIVAGAVVIWSMGLFGGWIIAGLAIRPIQTISAAATRISAGNLNERIPLADSGNELHELAMVLNTTFGRLHDAFERQRQFTADASHELRTPLTVILSETQRMRKKERSPREYGDSIEICHMAGLRMKKLVENLLLLAREGAGNAAVQSVECQLDEFILELVKPFKILGGKRGSPSPQGSVLFASLRILSIYPFSSITW